MGWRLGELWLSITRGFKKQITYCGSYLLLLCISEVLEVRRDAGDLQFQPLGGLFLVWAGQLHNLCLNL